VFLILRELRDSKKGKVRGHNLEISRRTTWAEVGHQEINRLGKSYGGVTTPLGSATDALFHLVRLIRINHACTDLFWSETTIYTPPGVSSRLRRWRSKTHKQKVCWLLYVFTENGSSSEPPSRPALHRRRPLDVDRAVQVVLTELLKLIFWAITMFSRSADL
jgi:hypothetical protein